MWFLSLNLLNQCISLLVCICWITSYIHKINITCLWYIIREIALVYFSHLSVCTRVCTCLHTHTCPSMTGYVKGFQRITYNSSFNLLPCGPKSCGLRESPLMCPLLYLRPFTWTSELLHQPQAFTEYVTGRLEGAATLAMIYRDRSLYPCLCERQKLKGPGKSE